MTSRLLLAALLGSFLVAPAPARAQKHSKKALDMQNVEVPVRAIEKPKPSAPAAPRLTLEQFQASKEATIQKLIDKQIGYLRRLIQNTSPDDPQLPDYWFRLGELFAAKHRYFEHRARSLDEPIFRAEHEDGAAPAVEPRRKQKSEQDQAGQSLQRAVSCFIAAAKMPRYPRMDEVLYRLGYLLERAGRADQARVVFHRLLKDHPQSRYVPDAYLAFADDFFAHGDMGQALAFYAKVTQFPKSPVYGFALYKKAWQNALYETDTDLHPSRRQHS